MKKRTLLKDVAYSKIKQKVLKGEESYTSENTLVEELQMSRTPIRAALQQLHHEGLVKIISNHGIVIPEMTVKEINDLFDMRVAIETFSLKQVIDMLTDADFEKLEAVIKMQEKARDDNDVILFIQYDIDMHLFLIEIGGNEVFRQILLDIRERFKKLSKRVNNPRNMERVLCEHKNIVEFLKSRDFDSAVAEMSKHLNKSQFIT